MPAGSSQKCAGCLAGRARDSVRGTIGIIANPASGKDIRRLIAAASVFDNQEKLNIVRRAILGAIAGGVRRVLYMPDSHRIVAAAADGIDGVELDPVESPGTASALDTTRAAAQMRERGCAAVITLGGDGTNRAAAGGWRTIPLVAVSTGTNNVFPRMVEGTLAGAAAALVATGRVRLARVAAQAKTITIKIDGEPDDLALVDAVLLDAAFIGARAIWEPAAVRRIVLARAEPAAVGMSAIGGLLRPLGDSDRGGLVIAVGEGGPVTLRAPVAPGLYAPVPIRDWLRIKKGETVRFEGPGLIALDGERERRLLPGQGATLSIRRDGPWVIDVHTALKAAARSGLFQIPPPGKNRGY